MLIKINAYMHLKKHIRMNKFADLEMSIFYFKRRPFVVMDLLNEKILTEKQLELSNQWIRSKYLPSKNGSDLL